MNTLDLVPQLGQDGWTRSFLDRLREYADMIIPEDYGWRDVVCQLTFEELNQMRGVLVEERRLFQKVDHRDGTPKEWVKWIIAVRYLAWAEIEAARCILSQKLYFQKGTGT
jgi:hypothetical protein